MIWGRTVAIVAGLLLVFIRAPLAGDFERAQEAFNRCDYSTAMSMWQALAEKGDAEAALRVAKEYWNGIFISEDRDEAAKWYQTALRLYRSLADKGDQKAELALGFLYLEGLTINVDYPEAMKWFHKAADQGNPRAIYEMGEFYAWGWDVERDGDKALAWYRKAASTGDAWAQDNLGYMLQEGAGAVRKDIDEAAKWIQMAAEHGNASAQLKVSAAYFLGGGVTKDIHEGLRWLEKAASHEECDLDVQNARYSLGFLYRHGHVAVSDREIEVMPNSREAVRWLEKTAECSGLQTSLAEQQLVEMYEEGDGVTQDYAEADGWLSIGAEEGDATSQFGLAEMYRDGLGVQQNYVLAHMWFNLASSRSVFRSRAAYQRELIASKMSHAQIDEAQRLARDWQPKCGEHVAQVRALLRIGPR